MPVTLQFTADVLEPDLYNDVQGLPDPFSLAVMIGISNTYTAGLYFRVRLVSPPADYTIYQVNLGLLNAGNSSIYSPIFTRNIPTLTAGEFDETVTMRLEAFSDAGYSIPYGSKDLSVAVHHFDHLDPAWTVLEHADFNGSMNGWSLSSAQGGYDTTYFYSSPSSVRVTYTGSSNYGPGYLKKTINVGSYSKARLVFHHYGRSGSDYQNNDDFELSIAGVLKKPRPLPLPYNQWNRICYNMPVNQASEIYFWIGGHLYHYPMYYVDEIWVIAK